MTQGLGDIALAPCSWLQYADYEMDPIRRSQNGSITPVTDWILYADHGMDPIRRSVTPDQVYVVHGEMQASDALRTRIQHELGWRALVPEHGSTWPC